MYSPDEDSADELFDPASYVLASDDSVVPVAASQRLIVVVVDEDTGTSFDVGEMQLVTSARTDVPRTNFHRVAVLIADTKTSAE